MSIPGFPFKFFNLHDVNIDIYSSMGQHGQREGIQLPEWGREMTARLKLQPGQRVTEKMEMY
jgi:hypothetical protein